MPMKYRLVVKPLTEKTVNAPLQGEILVNTEDGHISVSTTSGVKSATRELEAQLLVKEVILTKTDEELRKTLALLTTLDQTTFPAKLSQLSTLQTQVTDMVNTLRDIQNSVTNNLGRVKTSTDNLVSIYGTLLTVANTLYANLENFVKLQAAVNEITYMDKLVSDFSAKLTSDLADLGALKNSVKANVDSRIDASTFTNWKNGLIAKYEGLRSDSVVESLTFIHNT